MIAIIIGTIATIILFILVHKEAKKGGEDWYTRELRFLFGTVVLLMAFAIDAIAFGIYQGSSVEITKTTEIVSSVDLVALQDNSTMTGEFFLGSGSLNNKSCYAFYYETAHGYKFNTLDAESAQHPVYIQYISDNEAPRIDQYAIVERQTMTADGSNAWLFSIIAWTTYGKDEPGDLISEEVTSPALFNVSNDSYYDNFRYEIHIPEGSIKTDYTIDLK